MTMCLFVVVVMSGSKMMIVTAVCIRLSRDLYAGAQRSTGRQRVRHDLPYVALFCVRCEVLRFFLLQRLS